MKALIITTVMLSLVFCGGCSTVIRHCGDPGSDMNILGGTGVYRGVRMDSSLVGSKDSSAPFRVYGLIDFPFSAVGDTVILPYDLFTINSQSPEKE
jgi:uncharacterized protein YceK